MSDETVSSPSAAPAGDEIRFAPREPRRSRWPLFWGAMAGCLALGVLCVIGLVVVVAAASRQDRGAWSAGDKVAILPIEGEIVESREAIESLHRYAENDSVKAIVVRINSPGGAIVPSQEIFEEIGKVRKDSGKPVIASMDSVAASGGYYIAVACDRIVANPGTLTGSIGVIAQWFNVEDLMRWAKVKPETFTSGTMKDAGSPYRELTDTEKQYFQSIVTQLHGQFVRAVAAGRSKHMTQQQVASLADGRVFTGEEAMRLKLIDQLGNLQDAVTLAGSMAGLKGKPKTIYPRRERPGLLELLAGSDDSAESLLRKIGLARSHQFLYRWQ